MIRIRSKKNGFWRCGVKHSDQWTEYEDDRFNEPEMKRLEQEPMLQVEIVLTKDPKRK